MHSLRTFSPVLSLILAALTLAAARAQEPGAPAMPSMPQNPAAAATPQKPALTGNEPIWEAPLVRFDEGAYAAQVELLFTKFENATGKKLAPGPKKKVGLKIYADSGPGLATPVPLVKAVISALERRGFEKKNIFLVGLNQLRLRMTGYLPSLVTGDSPFKEHPVFVLESGKFYDPVWFYDSPLPERFDPVFAKKSVEGVEANTTIEQDRKSFLATPLFLESDFWINLPVYTDHETLGVNGALVNATLWNASNTARFFRSASNAPAAVAEMSAIPELRQTWVFTLASLERYQYIGGPYFNSLYTLSEPRLWLSTDPVAMDSLMLQRINQARKENGFKDVPEEIRTLDFAEQLGVGSQKKAGDRIVRVGQ